MSEQSAQSSDPIVSVSMPKSEWVALLSVEPYAKETYTDQGIAILNAFGAIHRAIGDENE